MKSYSVTLDGKACALHYTIDDREEVEGMFPRPDGTPGNFPAMVRENLIAGGSFRMQCVLVWAGVRHLGKQWTYEKVHAAMEKATRNGGVKEILEPAFKCILAEGVLGNVVVPKEPTTENEAAGDEGKALSTPAET